MPERDGVTSGAKDAAEIDWGIRRNRQSQMRGL
jgi:hypothetical protein